MVYTKTIKDSVSATSCGQWFKCADEDIKPGKGSPIFEFHVSVFRLFDTNMRLRVKQITPAYCIFSFSQD
ncbi:hypothetical protein IMSAGC014_01802 [Bacteroidaceae bacterium]|nr:hypothetical protein IMSAGC014_01802 [Bacteroidaceae bacterium]